MAFQWMRRALLALAPAALLALSACGSGTIESQFNPTRMIVFGGALEDMGNTSNAVNSPARYTVNDASGMWVKLMALDYNVPLASSASGGTDYATGNARVVLKPDAAGNNATPTVKEQIDAYLATNGGTFQPGDIVVLTGGISDIIVQMQAFRAGTISQDQLVANVKQAGTDLGAQAQRLVAAGASHVVLVGTFDLATTPWAVSLGQQTLLSTLSTDFNDALLVSVVDQGTKMLYIDIALLYNLMATNPGAYAMTDAATVVCTSVDPGPGIGIGTNQVNSALCTPNTVLPNVAYGNYLWADAVYPTPTAHSRMADYVFSRVRDRW
jgi:phospholipase/lecithinase/hemolysin